MAKQKRSTLPLTHLEQLYLEHSNKLIYVLVSNNSTQLIQYFKPHLHIYFLFQCDVIRSLNRYESPE